METDKNTSPLEMGHPRETTKDCFSIGKRGGTKGGGFKEDGRNYDGKRNFNEVIPI